MSSRIQIRLKLVFITFFILVFSSSVWADNQCASCHAKQVKQWRSSDHFHSMGLATPDTVLGNFDNQSLVYKNSTVTFSQKGHSLYITMPDLSGKQKKFKVVYTFGYSPLQQYMFAMKKGKYQFFPFAWDSRSKQKGGQRWFVLYPNKNINDEFHWSQMGQNWNQMCADCHSTDFKKGFDINSKTYKSTFSKINVSCAACHGDSSDHLRWAAGDKSIKNKGYKTYIGVKSPLFRANDNGTMISMAALKASKQIQVCASCHSRRASFSDRLAPEDFHQDYHPSLVSPDLYHEDGQILEEDYVWGSFLQSKMYAAGVTCTNCHNPHTGRPKLQGNSLCTQCHSQTKYDSPKHHGHPANSSGALCVNCHMPSTTYMKIDARRDHSLRIPRPDLTQSLGIPNACNGCHTDKDPKWAMSAIKQWHPDSRILGSDHFAYAFHKADSQAAGAAAALTKIAQNSHYPNIIRASALSRMANAPGPNTIVAIKRSLQDPEPLKRQAAIDAVAPFPVQERWKMINTLLDDKRMPIRADAGRSLAAMLASNAEQTLSAKDKQRLTSAIKEYRKVQAYSADRAVSHVNLGNLEIELGNKQQAEKDFLKGIEIEPIFIPSYINLADLYRSEHKEAKAQEILAIALKISPNNGTVNYALAMSFIRSKQKQDALIHLKKSAYSAHPSSRFIYTYALLLQDLNKNNAALEELKRAHHIAPNDLNVTYSLVKAFYKQKDYSQALKYSLLIKQQVPNNPQIQKMISNLKGLIKESP